MWIFTTSGFISAVQDIEDRTIIVRSRDRASLRPIAGKFQIKTKHTPYGDYPYRVIVSSEEFVAWVCKEASNVNYRNFKNEVSSLLGKKFSSALSKVWSTMHDVEDTEARRKQFN